MLKRVQQEKNERNSKKYDDKQYDAHDDVLHDHTLLPNSENVIIVPSIF